MTVTAEVFADQLHDRLEQIADLLQHDYDSARKVLGEMDQGRPLTSFISLAEDAAYTYGRMQTIGTALHDLRHDVTDPVDVLCHVIRRHGGRVPADAEANGERHGLRDVVDAIESVRTKGY